MKRLGGLWERLSGFENLYHAYRKARRGKRRSAQVSRFAERLEPELLGLQQALRERTYRPGPYRLFTIYERKPRVIAAAPFRDRVVHHAILNLIEAPLDRSFIEDSYACRRGKGLHRALDRYQYWSRRYDYVLKCDIRWYFPSIDHALLKRKLERRIKDRNLLALLGLIIDSSPPGPPAAVFLDGDDLLTPLERRTGIPIGNLTSQFFANLYLDDFDHYVKQELRIRPYLRYVDDMVFLARSKPELHDLKRLIEERLRCERLLLHPRKAHITPVSAGIDLLGFTLTPQRRRLRSENGHRFARKLRILADRYRRGQIQLAEIDPVVQAWLGHARHGQTLALRRKIFGSTIFRRDRSLPS